LAKSKVTEVITFDDFKRERFLKLLSAAESNSTHPIAKPILEFTRNQGIEAPSIDVFKETAGDGMELLLIMRKSQQEKLIF